MHGGGTGRPGRACKVLEFINNWANLIIHKPCGEPDSFSVSLRTKPNYLDELNMYAVLANSDQKHLQLILPFHRGYLPQEISPMLRKWNVSRQGKL